MLLLTQDQTRIVRRKQGSWKWQQAYGVVRYQPYTTQDGRYLWRSAYDVVRKASMPQLRASGYADLPSGSLHNRSVY